MPPSGLMIYLDISWFIRKAVTKLKKIRLLRGRITRTITTERRIYVSVTTPGGEMRFSRGSIILLNVENINTYLYKRLIHC